MLTRLANSSLQRASLAGSQAIRMTPATVALLSKARGLTSGAAASAMREEDVTIRAEGRPTLRGTITHPSDNGDTTAARPALLVVPGSGAIDRNANARALQLNVYNRLAEHVASECGMVVLRYDKRGVGASKDDARPDLHRTSGFRDAAEDVVALYRWLREQEGVDGERVFIAGHSEGCMLQTAAYTTIKIEGVPPPRGMLYLAGFGTTLEEAVMRQRKFMRDEAYEYRGMLAPLTMWGYDQLEKINERFLAEILACKEPEWRRFGGLVKMNARWLQEHFAYDLHGDLRDVDSHILAITGQKDVQVDWRPLLDAETRVPRASSVETLYPKDLNHILRSQEEAAKIGKIGTVYKRQGAEGLDEGVVATITDWLNRHSQP